MSILADDSGPFTEIEWQTVEGLKKKGKLVKGFSRIKYPVIQYLSQGNFTVAIVLGVDREDRPRQWVGVSKYNNDDKKINLPFKNRLGRRIALYKALNQETSAASVALRIGGVSVGK